MAASTLFTSSDTDIIIDIAGYFTDNANPSNLVFYPLNPCRVVDTRFEYRAPSGVYGPPSMNARETRRIRFPGGQYCQVPAGAAAYSMTITAVPQGALQYLTAWPSGGSQPNVSSINSPAGRVLANNVILPASSDGSVDVFTFDRTDFLININGYFAPDDGVNGLFYYPVTQCRAAGSTSNTLGGSFGMPNYEVQIARTLNLSQSPGCSPIPATAKAYVINVTALPMGGLAFITAYPSSQSRPNVSILNAFQGQIVTNTAIVPAGLNGGLDIFRSGRTNEGGQASAWPLFLFVRMHNKHYSIPEGTATLVRAPPTQLHQHRAVRMHFQPRNIETPVHQQTLNASCEVWSVPRTSVSSQARKGISSRLGWFRGSEQMDTALL